MAAIYMALASCSTEHPVFYEDKVDIHLNPKIGADWQLLGSKNALSRRGRMKSTILPVRWVRAKTITLIVDNYIIHKSRETLRWLKANPKFRVIYQPVYSPWANRVERL